MYYDISYITINNSPAAMIYLYKPHTNIYDKYI